MAKAEALFDDESKALKFRFIMSEYMEKFAASRLNRRLQVMSAMKKGGELTEKRIPSSYLTDNPPDIFNVLLLSFR